MSTSVLSFTPSINDLHLNTINGVLGNASQSHVSENSTLTDKVQAHLNYVLKILESGQFAPTSLTEEQKHNRSLNISYLRRYTFSMAFPRQFSYPDPSSTHRPCFVDDEKRLCAVGHLMATTGALELVEQINTKFRFAYVRDIDLSLIEPWQQANGLSVIELAMIQPSYSHEHYRYDILYNGPPQVTHTNVRCDNCETSPIIGVRYKCVNCPNYDLCQNCESLETLQHARTHVFLKLRYPIVTEPSNTHALLPHIAVRHPNNNDTTTTTVILPRPLD